MSNLVVIKQTLNQHMKNFENIFPGKPEQKKQEAIRFLNCVGTQLNKVPKLQSCSPESIVSCALQCAEIGLMPNGIDAHLIPYGQTCTLIPDIKGLMRQLHHETDITCYAEVVCNNDNFSMINGQVEHSIDYKMPRGDMYAVYAIATFKDGRKVCQVMTKDEVEDIKKRSKAGASGPWKTDYSEMAKKTILKRILKHVGGTKTQQALAVDNEMYASNESKAMKVATPANDGGFMGVDMGAGEAEEEVKEIEATESTEEKTSE